MSINKLLTDRELIKQKTNFTIDEKSNFYIGFDPTADSLHIGSLLPIVIAKALIRHNKNVKLLIGDFTGMIGDPSGKSKERSVLTEDIVLSNAIKIKKQLKALIPEADIVFNREWLSQLNLLSFLRDIGKHISVKKTISLDSVKSRLETEEGIS